MDPSTDPAGQWDGLVRRHVDITVRAVDEKGRWVDVTASTNSLDSHNTILDQDWRLDRYRKNPVVLWNHNRFEHGPFSLGGGVRPEDFLPIARGENVGVVDGELRARLVFASADSNPLADRIFKLMGERILNSVSVGFRPGTVTEEKFDGREILRLGQNELYEISVVPVPSNPDAVAKSAAVEREHLGRMAAGKSAGGGERTGHMPMTAEEKAAYDAALARSAASDVENATLKSASERDVKTITRLEAELKAASDRTRDVEDKLKASEQQVRASEVEKLVGVKFYPAERDEMVQLAADIGLARVQKIAAARPDIKLTDPVRAGGKELNSSSQPAPAPVEGADSGSEDIVKTALAAASAAA